MCVCVCVTVSFDGIWHERGFASNYGVGIIIDVATGLVTDFKVLSKYRQACTLNNKNNMKEIDVIKDGQPDLQWSDVFMLCDDPSCATGLTKELTQELTQANDPMALVDSTATPNTLTLTR